MKVFDKNGQLICDINESKEIARGGEGRVLDLDANHVVKLYLPNVKPIAESKFSELHLLNDPKFIKPESLFYDSSKKVVGFSMRKVPSDFFPLVSLLNKVFCNRESITLKVKREIITSLIAGVQFAHSKNVVIGDLNPYNILVNKDGVVYFIDTDSFQTPGFKHSGILLEDVRDFLFNGDVTMHSDYFALAILIFNILTYVHPFKGVHKKYPKISDRMIHKESVLSNSPDLIVPKCYEPLTQVDFIQQFQRVFNNGERFIINLSLNQPVINNTVKAPVVILSNNLNIKLFYENAGDTIVASACSKELLVILMASGYYYIYDTSLKGTITLLKKDITTAKDIKLFVYQKSVYAISNDTLFKIYPNFIAVADFDSSIKIKANLYGSNLVIITDQTLYTYDLSKQMLGSIPYTSSSVFGRGFTQIDDIFQHVSGKTVLLYNEKNSLNFAVCDMAIKNIIQRDNIVLVEQINNEQISYNYFSIKGLKANFLNSEEGLRYFDQLNDDISVIPDDNKLILKRNSDMNPLMEFECSVSSTDSIIYCTNAGILVINENSCYLTNKK